MSTPKKNKKILEPISEICEDTNVNNLLKYFVKLNYVGSVPIRKDGQHIYFSRLFTRPDTLTKRRYYNEQFKTIQTLVH